ncbi:MAG TPA: CDP-diacylglycerol--serine O-phosphatidyltransferase [Flavobacteriales bacterium]|nr:CDP-diacylglycerol--serine O-phosphatidyltransferase [Flavobacteriales bacterium]
MSLKSHIPNLLTCVNLLCGCLAIICVLTADTNQMHMATYLIWLAAFFDFLDGMSARLLKSYSQLGKQLDSLADMVSFGVAPGMILYALIQDKANVGEEWIAYFALVIPVFSAWRLAIFNIDESQSDSFRGLPTPANALLIGSLPLLFERSHTGIHTGIAEIIGAPSTLAGIGIALSLLLVSKVGMFSLKVKSFRWEGNQLVYVFLIVAAVILLVLPYSALPIIVLLYIVISVLQSLFFKRKKT